MKMLAVSKLCRRAILTDEGWIVAIGDIEKVINNYSAMLQQK